MEISSTLELGQPHQNAALLLQQLAIASDRTKGLDDLVLELEAILPLASPESWRIECLRPTHPWRSWIAMLSLGKAI